MTRGLVLATLVLATLSAAASPAAAVTLPPSFTDTVVANVASPTAIAFTPDGRMLVATQPGRLYAISNGTPVTALDLSAVICADAERGMLGVAVDPSFASNHYIYVDYTYNKSGSCPYNTAQSPVNRVSRFTLSDQNTVSLASESVLVDNMPSPNGNHNAGDVHFGKDGNLYISIGDGGCSTLGPTGCGGTINGARDLTVLSGKILRITPAGEIPAGNPFLTTPGSARCNVDGRTSTGTVCQEIFALGLRNPFRIAFDPNAAGTRFYINDVGQNIWEEIDLGAAGADYGWNVREGHCAIGSTTDCGAPPAGMTNPIYDYDHATGCHSITGGAFVPTDAWPAPYAGRYLFGDYICGKIFQLVPSGSGFTSSVFADAVGSNGAPIAMTFGPFAGGQALYYASYLAGGSIHRISYDAGGPDTTKPTPSVLSATPGTGQIVLNWTAATDNVGVARYAVWMDNRWLAAASASARSYTATGLAAGVSHSFRVVAYDAAGNYANSNTVTAAAGSTGGSDTTKPTAPALAATPGSGQVVLNWTAATDNVGVTRYAVWMDNHWLAAASASARSYTATGLAAGVSHSFRVVAYDAAGNYANSNTVSAAAR